MNRTFQGLARVLLLSSVLALTACGLAPEKEQTFYDIANKAGLANDAVVVVTNTLLNTHTIGTADAKRVLVVTDRVHDGVTLAVTLYGAGDATQAAAVLSTAQSKLTTLQVCTRAPDVSTNLGECIKPAESAP